MRVKHGTEIDATIIIITIERSPSPLQNFDWRAALKRLRARWTELPDRDSDHLITITLNVVVRERTPSLTDIRWIRDRDQELRERDQELRRRDG